MNYEVRDSAKIPADIERPDKIVAGLTARQLAILAVAVADLPGRAPCRPGSGLRRSCRAIRRADGGIGPRPARWAEPGPACRRCPAPGACPAAAGHRARRG